MKTTAGYTVKNPEMLNFKRILSVFFFAVMFSCSAEKEPVLKADPNPKIAFNPEKYLCIKTNHPIEVDGDIYDAEWEIAEWTHPFVDIEGERKPLPPLDTKVKMLWDGRYLYIAAELKEPHIWATLTEHDAVIYQDDDFEVFIDPDGDSHNYYEYEINALGTDWDLFLSKPYRDGGLAVDSWEIPGLLKGIKIYGSINDPQDEDEKWTVELAFPWEVLRELNRGRKIPEPGDQWRMGFSRVDWTMGIEGDRYYKKKDENGKILPENNWVWSPQGVIAMHQPETWGYVQFAVNKTDNFVNRPDEQVKWALRQLYYRQKAYYAENKRYTDVVNSLRLEEVEMENEAFMPEIILIPNGFVASHPSLDKNGIWLIESDGLIRFLENKK